MSTKEAPFKIFGRIIDRKTKSSIGGLRVEAWDPDLLAKNKGGSAVGDARGSFKIEFDPATFRKQLLKRRPLLFFRVFREGLVQTTRAFVVWSEALASTEIVIEGEFISEQTDLLKRLVKGKVVFADGSPAAGVVVTASNRDLRQERELGQSHTDSQGFYEIHYSDGHPAGAIGGAGSLVVKALAADGSLLVASQPLFNPPAAAEVDLTIPVDAQAPPPLFAKIRTAIDPFLGGIDVRDLNEDESHHDVSFLSGRTGWEKAVIARYVLAHKLAQDHLLPEFWFALLDNSIFLFDEDQTLDQLLKTVTDGLSSLDAAAVRNSLARAFDQNEIPRASSDQTVEWVEFSLKFVASRAVGDSAQPTFLLSAAEHAGITDRQLQEKFALLYNQYKAITPDLLAAVQNDPSFSQEQVADLHTSFQLAELTQGDFSVVKVIKEGFGIRQPEEIRSLAKKSQSEWVNLVNTKLATGEIKLPIEIRAAADSIKLPAAEVYGRTLDRQFREAYPTTAFAGGLERALSNGGVSGLLHAEALGSFLAAHQNFELLRTPVDDFLKNNVHPEFAGLAGNKAFVQEIKAVQRVFKLAPTFEAADVLLAAGLHSAQQIYRLGESQFVQRYGLQMDPNVYPGAPNAGVQCMSAASKVWSRAADTHAAATTIVADLKALDPNSLPQALLTGSQALTTFPNWESLFQTGDLCDCEACRSVIGPAAYFADLLMYLKDRQAADHIATVKDILFSRRPDLGYLELNCENALTPLPYIDVVCEVLEAAIAKDENDVELIGLTNIPDTSATTKTTIANALQTASLDLGADFSLSQVDPLDPDRWVAHGERRTYLLKKKTTVNFFAEVLRNTKAKADELRANPQYVNPKAYETLREAQYPMALPFDLFAEEVRAAMQKTNLQRWDLMTTLRGNAIPNNPSEGEIAAEYFGISVGSAALRFNGTMNAAQRTTLLTHPSLASVTGIPSYKEAVDELFERGRYSPVNGLSSGFTFPAVITGTPNNIPISYEPFRFDEKRLILFIDISTAGQRAVWGETGNANWLDVTGNFPDSLFIVKNFLRKTGLEYNELLALLDLKFINPAGDIAIHHLDTSCDTAKKIIQGLNTTKLDRIHRFLRLWRKLKGWKMWEVDLVIRHPRIGNNLLDEAFLIDLFYFAQLKDRLGKKATVEHVCALFGDLNIETRFTKLHEPRADALYQQLFLNRRLINPLDPAFALDPTTGDLPAGQSIPGHRPVITAALGVSELDLVSFEESKKFTDGLPYLNHDLTLANLSFLWRHSWLSKVLKFKADEWQTVLTLWLMDLSAFLDPKAAWQFVTLADQLKATGFTVDELNWLLLADRSAKAAVKETDAARFLSAVRKDLQKIHAENDPSQYAFLTVATPTDEGQLTALLTTLLQKLNRSDEDAKVFLAILRGRVNLETQVQNLPPTFASFPPNIIGPPNNIPIHFDALNKRFQFTGLMTGAQRTLLLTDPSLAVTGDSNYQNAIEELFQLSGNAAADYASTEIEVALPGGLTLPSDGPSIPIKYSPITQKLTFIGIMTPAERSDLISAGNPAGPIKELFKLTRLAMKFFEPSFSTPLAALPLALDFKAQLPAELAARISYDAEQRLLQFDDIMSSSDRAMLGTLVPAAEFAYQTAINDLASQPETIVATDERVWLTDPDLDTAVAANDTLAKRLANAATKALNYLSKALAVEAVILQSSAQLKLTEAMTRLLLTQYAVVLMPSPPNKPLLDYLTQDFATTPQVVDYSSFQDAFNGWFWATRVAALWKKWKITLADWEQLTVIAPNSRLLDIETLPIKHGPSLPIFLTDRFLRTSRLLRLRDTLPETDIKLLEILEKLNKEALTPSTYSATAFADDVERLNENWPASDVLALVGASPPAGAFDLVYPTDYLFVERWERLSRAFDYLDTLDAGPDLVKTFAAPAMSDVHAQILRELLRSKFGSETWLTLSTEIQDVLRERKRDALAAYLLTKPPTTTPPSGKWENTNDLYAYYLLDIEMSSCQLTSRLVQASGSVQLFVQRCFMSLEPQVKVQADGATGDSAWRWWKWMRKYQVWVANRKVFLWPENWIEPELKPDRSQFFKDLENELLQNEIDQSNVETAFANYLEKLDGVAQLEIAGFFQEDDGDNAIVHVFGRTKGAEPHIYYYRRYDYRQWTPWEKVDLDIQGDYLIPAVVNRELFLFWPVFTEVPNEQGNSSVATPTAGQDNAQVQKTKKNLRLQMAVSDYRKGKWTPKRISTDFALSNTYDVEIVRKHYWFYPIDRSEIDGRFGIRYQGYSSDRNGSPQATLVGAFEIAGCKGVPALADLPGRFRPAIRPEAFATGATTSFQRWLELGAPPVRGDKQNDLSLESYGWGQVMFTRVLLETPWLFKMTTPWHLSYFDKLLLDGLEGNSHTPNVPFIANPDAFAVPLGSWLPFFYDDRKRTFFVLPAQVTFGFYGFNYGGISNVSSYYPQVKKVMRDREEDYECQIEEALARLDLHALPGQLRNQVEQFLKLELQEERNPPYSDTQLKALLKRFYMRSIHWSLGTQAMATLQFRQFHFKNFYHPFVCDFAKLVYNPIKGIPALMSRETQLQDSGFSFRQSYVPTSSVVSPPTETFYPKEIVDFSPDGSYSSYNWELFFHAPLLIANSLSKNQRFEEARDWYHFIFNPIGVESSTPGGSAMSKFWITKPFFETTGAQSVQQRIDNILGLLAGNTNPGLENQVLDWRTNPFEPHRIANYRTVAYQKTTVMKYLDNLIAWGDNLFRQESMESINEATQLYVLAAELLGPPPKNVPPQAKPPLETFNELEKQFDKFSNALVEVENLVPPLSGNANAGNPAPLPTLYFCIPHNEKMLGYWNTVADRLYKIRHCMNIEGVVRQLALFEPPIDPAALVKAVAGGIDIGAALSDLNAPLPIYRFNVFLQKANEVCNDVKALGSALLSALEKRDAEALALLRGNQEIRLLEAVKAVREKQMEEAKENLEGAKCSRVTVETRRNYYRDIERLSTQEKLHLDKLSESHKKQEIAQGVKLGGSIIALLPGMHLGASGFGGSPHAKISLGGLELGQAASIAGDVISFMAQIAANDSIMASSKGSFDRRWDDWKLQERLAEKELDQMDRQIAAAELRVAIAGKELENHVIQIENAKAIDAFMRSKYTNQELYQWQVGQISAVYFQSYKLAYDLAKRAERCFRFELGVQDSSYINFGYWDSLKKGLLAGEKLQYDLRRLETAYLDQNRREFELTKHISLALLDPLALIRLRETGRCFFQLPEEIFDLDYPGHYFRRIKSVSLTLPCVTGPYTTISCTLRLLNSKIRITTDVQSGYRQNEDNDGLPADDPRFIENNIPVKAIAASNAQNDSGVFELNFRDDRYLPFEGAGVISGWALELFTDLPANNPDPTEPDFGRPLRQFDYETISDAIVHVKYTDREDAGLFKNSAVKNLRNYFRETVVTPSLRMLDLRQEFPSQWHRFLTPVTSGGPNIFEFEMSPSLFQIKDLNQTLKINTIWLLARCADSGVYEITLTPPSPVQPVGSNIFSLLKVNQYGGLHFSQKDVSVSGLEVGPTDSHVPWRLQMTRPLGANLKDKEVEDLILVLGYQSVP